MLYFIPKATGKPNQKALAELKLGHAFEGETSAIFPAAGPGDEKGVLMYQADLGLDIASYQPEHQTWRKVPGSIAWVGIDRRNMPKPEQLLRKETIAGEKLTLADGKSWLIPVSRKREEQDGKLVYVEHLPQVQECDEEGNWKDGAVLEKFHSLWKLASDYTNYRWFGDTDVFKVWTDLLNAAVTVLAVNYRIGPAEASLLKLLTKQSAVEVLCILIDAKTYDDWTEKKRVAALAESASENSSSGVEV